MKAKNSSNKNQASKIPKTGKIGNLARNIEKETSQDVLLKVMQNVDEFKSTSNRVEKAEWVKGVIERLYQQAGREKSIKIMEHCGKDCCTQELKNHIEQLMSESKSIEEFLSKWSRGSFKFELVDKNTVIGEYKKCYCSMVNKILKPFSTKIYCYCGAEHVKQLFESALGKPVEVELVQSVIAGAKSCKFLIHI